MKKFLTLVVALAMVIPSMAIGRNDGSTKANAIDFDWDKGVEHVSGTKWYRVDLAPLYEEENPSLTLYLTNPSNAVGTSVDVSMQATVAGQTESKDYTIAARQYKTYTANASMLVRMKQTEIYLTLSSTGKIKLSAKVFEAADLDETCKDARTLAWGTAATQNPSYSAWWKVSLTPIKSATDQDAKITITNTGSKTVNLKVGQSLDCPSSGVTKREYTLAAGESVINTVPRAMITNVQPDELYFGIENVESQISIMVEKVAQPATPIIPDAGIAWQDLHVTDTIEPLTTGYYRIKVADMDSLAKYEPEFTYRNAGTANANVKVKMAFELPAYGTSDAEYNLAPGEEEIVVYKKNMLEGLGNVEYIYLLTEVTGDVNFYGRFKHVREGKACKTNIDFNWDAGHTQEARTTQWYAIDLSAAKAATKDVIVYVDNLETASATVKASMAFSCPYIDLQEITRTVGAGAPVSRRLAYSSYAMMSDTVWIGLETNKNIRFWAETVDAEVNAEVDTICLHAIDFNWQEGVMQHAGDTVWYLIDMNEVRDLAAKFPTVFVQNLSNSASAKIDAELSLDCPDSIKNESRSLTIAANESYSKQLSRNLFENIKQDTIYLRVISTQDISLQIRLSEAAEGTDCSSAIPFNWVSGNSQKANENLWYSVDLRQVMQAGNDLRLHIENKDAAACKGVIQLSYECPVVAAPSIQNFNLAANGDRAITIQNSALETLEDSIVYINLQGTTALRFWAELLPLEPFDTIYAAGITLTPLHFDVLYTQAQDTAWYIIPKSEIDSVLKLDQKVKPVAHLYNIGTAENTYKVEAAFAFPIVKKMMTKSQKLAAGKHFSDTIPASTFDQILKKDSIIIRVTRPVGSGDFQFKAELVKAFNGNTRNDALPIRLGELYTQAPNTEMWYKLNTADLKKDTTLYNKVLWIQGKNAGAGDAKVNVSVYEGLLSETDMLEEYGLADYRERTIKKGQGKSHNFPAQAIYGVGDVELYIKVRTTDSLVFESRFNGTYAPQAVDPEQAKATLVVPNVEYVVPGDNQEHWYMVCLPYIRNNYVYTDAAKLSYELNGQATIEGTFTFQDEMDCAMPVRKRTINRSGGNHHGTKPLSELINKAIKKATKRDFDVSTFQPNFVDSMLRRYVTSDSITAYVRIKTDNDLKVKLIMEQITGDQCTNAMPFDWEHGNVNPENEDMWYHVKLDSLIIPDTCDLRLHVDNWSAVQDSVQADLYFDCNDPATKKQPYTLAANGKDSIDIDRDFLEQLGWAPLLINFYSEQNTHIWAELIPDVPRDTLYDTITVYVCKGGMFEDTIRNNYKLIDPVEYSMEWNDTVTFQDGVTMVDSVITFYLHPLVSPDTISVDSMKKMDAAPLLVQGMQLYVETSNAALTAYYRNLGNTVDTITRIDTAYWAKPVYDEFGDWDNGLQAALDLTTYYPKGKTEDTLLLVIESDTCGFIYRQRVVFPVEDYKYVTKSDTICPPVPAINPDTIGWQVLVPDTLGRDRQIDTIVTYVARTLPVLYTQGQILEPIVDNSAAIDATGTIEALLADFAADADELTMDVTDAKWQVFEGGAWIDLQNASAVSRCETNVTMRYVITTECGDVLNSDDFVYNLTGIPAATADTTAAECAAMMWRGQNCNATGDYVDTQYDADGCEDLITTLHFTLLVPTTGDTTAVACDSFTWYDGPHTTSGDYQYTLTNAAGCDSIVTLHLTINYHAETTKPAETACDSYYWAEADTTITTTGTYVHVFNTVLGCDSIVTFNATINNSAATTADPVTECNAYYWEFADSLITTTGTYAHTEATIHGCDSTVTITVTINVPYVNTLEVRGYYGNRIIMINRNQINSLPGWGDLKLDSLDNGKDYVKWYQMVGADPNPDVDTQVATGYYYTLESGDPIPAGSYYATVQIPASDAAMCGAVGTTEVYVIGAASPAPALVPSLARPGEEVKVINLDPTMETTIRIYSAEGLLQKTYTSSNTDTFVMQAAYDNGFYLVELTSDSMKTTLRYIVK